MTGFDEMKYSAVVRNILIKFRNRDITQDAAEDQLLDLINGPEIVGDAKVDYTKLVIDYNELANAILRNDPDYSPHLKKMETFSVIEEIPLGVDWEKTLVLRALKQCNGNRKKAALLLTMSERTLYRKIKQYSIEDDFKHQDVL